MDDKRLAEIEQRLNAATPAPWVYDFPLVGKYNESGFYDALCEIDDSAVGEIVGRANCYLIAYAPADIAALIAEVKRLRAALVAPQPMPTP